MTKKTPKKEAPADVAKAASVMGRKKFNQEVQREMQAGLPPEEAADLIARRKLKGYL